MKIVQMCPLEQCSNLPHVQTRNITPCYNKEGVITDVTPIPQDIGHLLYVIWHNQTYLYQYNADTNRLEFRIQKLLCEKSSACHFAYSRLNAKMEGKWKSAAEQG
jgi:hypothetical protein